MRNPVYAKEKNNTGDFWLACSARPEPFFTNNVPEEHMRLISILALAEDNAYIPGVGMRTEEQPSPGMVRYILDLNHEV